MVFMVSSREDGLQSLGKRFLFVMEDDDMGIMSVERVVFYQRDRGLQRLGFCVAGSRSGSRYEIVLMYLSGFMVCRRSSKHLRSSVWNTCCESRKSSFNLRRFQCLREPVGIGYVGFTWVRARVAFSCSCRCGCSCHSDLRLPIARHQASLDEE